jgi:hypothetical protein
MASKNPSNDALPQGIRPQEALAKSIGSTTLPCHLGWHVAVILLNPEI